MGRRSLPKYETVKNYVISHIEDSKFQPHERIPSETELADALNVSSITVRKALSDLVHDGVIYRIRGKGSFVADQIEGAAKLPSNLVVFIISGIQMYDSSYLRIIKGMQVMLAQHELKLVIEFVENNVAEETELVFDLMKMDFRGMLIYSADPNVAKEYLKKLKSSGCPFVMLDRFPQGTPVNCIVCNNQDGVYEATDYLIGLGHRHIGFAAYDYHLSSEVDRYNGYANALSDSNIRIDDSLVFLDKKLDYEALYQRIKRKELTALVCVNDRKALEAIDQLTARGVSIPEEFSVMGFDDFESSQYAKIPLSTVKQDFEVLGYESAKLLLEVMKEKSGTKKILLPTSLVIRESTAQVRRDGE